VLTAQGTVDDFPQSKLNDVRSRFASRLNVPEANVTVTVEPASVRLTITINHASSAAAATAVSVLQTEVLATPELASSFTNTVVVSAPTVSASSIQFAVFPPDDADSGSAGLSGGDIVAIAIGSSAAWILCMCATLVTFRHYIPIMNVFGVRGSGPTGTATSTNQRPESELMKSEPELGTTDSKV
jgi:hypothetical protein